MDITDRKREQERLAEEEERSRLIIESVADGLFDVDAAGRITFVNPAATSMLGYSVAEMVGMRSHELVHARRPDGTPYDEKDCPMYAAYVHGQTARIDDELLWRKDGTGLPVEYRATPILRDGAIRGAVISFTDITERKVRDDAFRAVWSVFQPDNVNRCILIAHGFPDLALGIRIINQRRCPR